MASASDDENIIIWNTDSHTVQHTFSGHENKIEYIVFVKNSIATRNIFLSDYVELFNKNLGTSVTSESLVEHQKGEGLKDLNAKLLEKSELMKTSLSDNKISKEYLISCSRDKSIKIWDIFSGTCVFTVLGHDNWVRCVQISANGKFIYSCGDDKTIRLWDLKTGKCVKKLDNAHDGFVVTLAMNYKSPIIASGSLDQVIKIWDCK